MKLRFTLILLALLCFACNIKIETYTEPVEQVKNVLPENAQLVPVPFLNRELLIPAGYINVSVSEMQSALKRIVDDRDFANSMSDYMAQIALGMTDVGADYMIFVDQNNLANLFIIQKKPYVDFDKNAASMYLGRIQNILSKSARENNIKLKRLESRYLKTKKSKLYKNKFRQYRGDLGIYNTEYIITSGKQTFAILIISHSNIDFEEIVRHL